MIFGDSTIFIKSGPKDPKSYLTAQRINTSVEQALNIGSRWATFEENDADTWGTMLSSTLNYFNTIWLQTTMLSKTASPAYSAQCGLGDTMTGDDILNGYLILKGSMIPNIDLAVQEFFSLLGVEVRLEIQTS
ncbi:MAG: hypothetical protein WCK42_03320 [Myxococcaceae bacterium]